MDYEKLYKEALERAKTLQKEMIAADFLSTAKVMEQIFPELAESKDEKIRKAIIDFFVIQDNSTTYSYVTKEDIIAWLEKQGEKANPYSGISFEYNGNIWGMCARDNGVDILLDKKLFKHLEKKGEQKELRKIDARENLTLDGDLMQADCMMIEQKPTWSEEDEKGLGDTLWAIKQAIAIAKDENDMGTLWYAENWLKSIKQKLKGEQQ